MKFLAIYISALIFLTGCHHHNIDSFDSPFYKVPINSKLVLNQDIVIPPNRARVLIQYGKILSRRQIDQYYPYCEFEIRTLSNQEQIIKADEFIVIRLKQDVETSLNNIMYASVSNDRGSLLVAYNTMYHLESIRQPDVLRLMCMYWTDDSLDHYLTHNETRQALGDLFSFQLADEQ